MTKSKAFIFLNIAVFLFGLAGVFGKIILLPAVIIVFGRVFFASVSLFFFAKINGQPLKIDSIKDKMLMILMGLILAFHWFTFFYAIQISTVTIGLLSFSTFPVFVALLEPVFFKEKLKFIDVLLAMLLMLGISLVIPEFDIKNNITQGVLCGMMSGFTFAVLTNLNRLVVKKYDGIQIAFYQDVVATVVLLPALYIVNIQFSALDIFSLILLGVLCTAIAHVLFISSMKVLKAKTVSLFGGLELVYGIIFGVLFFNDILELRMALGACLIFVIVLFTMLRKNE